MAFTVPTVQNLADFSGRPFASFTTFANQALIQGVLYFQVVTELIDPPIDPGMAQLAINGILDFSLVTYLEQPYQGIKANPFQSQTVGSTSYSKPVMYMRGNAQANALKGEQTGIMWFDLAVQQLALRTQRGGVFGGAVHMFDTDWSDGVYSCPSGIWLAEDEDEFGCSRRRILGPADINTVTDVFFDWNLQGEDVSGNGG